MSTDIGRARGTATGAIVPRNSDPDRSTDTTRCARCDRTVLPVRKGGAGANLRRSRVRISESRLRVRISLVRAAYPLLSTRCLLEPA